MRPYWGLHLCAANARGTQSHSAPASATEAARRLQPPRGEREQLILQRETCSDDGLLRERLRKISG